MTPILKHKIKAIPYGKQDITQDDIQAVVETLQADFLTQGPQIGLFEEAFASYVGSKYAVAVSNGTAALHLSALALGVNEESTVICTPITFAASSNCIKYCGGNIHFSDINKDTYLIDIPAIKALLEQAPKGKYAGIIPVDLAGKAVNLEELRALADEHDLWIIEDACHAPGGYFIDSAGEKQFCGNGKFADLSVFSFHPVKHIACGEGGMITTNDQDLYERLLALRSHGITRDSSLFKNDTNIASGEGDQESYPNWYMEMQDLGFNYRLTDFQAALGLSQLKKANDGLQKRRQIAKKYAEAFDGKTFIKGQSGSVEGHAYHLYIVEFDKRLELYNHLRESQIYSQIHYIPTHLMPYYKNEGWKKGDLKNAEKYYQHCLSLPMYPTLSNEEQAYVIKTILDFYNG